MPKLLAALLPLLLLASCGAITAVTDATTRLDAYTLSPYRSPQADRAALHRHLVVELPTAPGAIATDRILIKPVPLQAQYLPDGRWTEPAPALVQGLLVATFQDAGMFRLVAREAAGLMPEYTLMTEVQEFQAEPDGKGSSRVTVRVAVVITLIRESDRRILGSRRLAATTGVASDGTLAVVGGFERAMQAVLREAVAWTGSQTR